MDLEGSGDLDLADASCEAVEVTLEGSGDVRVRATRTVTVRLRGSGNVTVLGSPDARDEQVTGSGQVTYP